MTLEPNIFICTGLMQTGFCQYCQHSEPHIERPSCNVDGRDKIRKEEIREKQICSNCTTYER